MEQDETIYFPYYPWIEYNSSDTGIYFYNEETGETTLNNPIETLLLPIGWKVAQANGHVSFFFFHEDILWKMFFFFIF